MLTKFPTFRKVMLLTGVLLLTALAVYLALHTVLAVYPAEFSTDIYYQMMPSLFHTFLIRKWLRFCFY